MIFLLYIFSTPTVKRKTHSEPKPRIKPFQPLKSFSDIVPQKLLIEAPSPPSASPPYSDASLLIEQGPPLPKSCHTPGLITYSQHLEAACLYVCVSLVML